MAVAISSNNRATIPLATVPAARELGMATRVASATQIRGCSIIGHASMMHRSVDFLAKIRLDSRVTRKICILTCERIRSMTTTLRASGRGDGGQGGRSIRLFPQYRRRLGSRVQAKQHVVINPGQIAMRNALKTTD
jgi:hypothetical protein